MSGKRARSSKRIAESSRPPSSPPPPPNRFEILFQNEAHKRRYDDYFVHKNLAVPKYINLNWCLEQGFEFAPQLVTQDLGRFISLKGRYYPELVKVFYARLEGSREGALRSYVKGVEMIITPDIWESIAGLDFEGANGFHEEVGGYNKGLTYQSMLDPNAPLGKRFAVGPMKASDRLLLYIITYILTPRGTNHAQATDEDLQLVYGIKNDIKINWIYFIQENMLKAKRLHTYPLPYAILISKFIEYFQVDLDEEAYLTTSMITNKIQEKDLHKMGMRKTPNGWIMANRQVAAADEEEEEAPQPPPEPSQPGPSQPQVTNQDLMNFMEKMYKEQGDQFLLQNQRLDQIDKRFDSLDGDMVEMREILNTILYNMNDDGDDDGDN